MYAALTQFQPFNSFSNDGNCRGNGMGVALETPHNAIHNAMDPGHMSPPATAAFDPVFWLHHSWVVISSFFPIPPFYPISLPSPRYKPEDIEETM